MKFTVDLDNKTISIHGPFMVKEIDELLSLLNIEDKDTWLIEKYQQPINFGTGNPYIYGTANTGGSITLSNGNSNLTYTNGSIVSGTTTNTWSVQNHDGKSI
jgi:hypothetical protein